MNDEIAINLVRLKEDLKDESLGVFFRAGFGGALIEAGEVERASPKELVQMAIRKGIDLSNYII